MSIDAIIIGSGPGGATAADVLTQAGWSVVIMEKGRNHLLDPNDLSKPGTDYSNDEIKFMARYFLGPDPIVEPRTFRLEETDGDHTHVGEVNSIPTTVGGGGTHADGKVPRFRADDFRVLSTFGPHPGAEIADWPVDYDELEPYYTEVERAIGVSGDAEGNPFAEWRSGPYPMPPGAPMYGALLSSAAALEHGLHPYAAPTAANSVPYDGRPACNNCGFCAFFGCPIHAKGDPVALLMRTMATGRAELMAETFVSKILITNGQATGVEYIDRNGETHQMSARHVILAAGAIETPRLLLLSGLENRLIGKHLMVHFQTISVGEIAAESLHGEKGRSVTHVHDDYIVGDELSQQAAKDAGLPWLRGGMTEHGGPSMAVLEAKLYPWGPLHRQLMRNSNLRDHLWAFTMQGEDLPRTSNTVDLDPTVRDVRGFPVARITYKGGPHEVAASDHFGPRLEAVLKDMGATWTISTTSPGIGYRGGESPVPESRHVIGTARMGDDPATSVVDRYNRYHGIENLLICDSSVFVTAAGYGPTLTLVALSARASHLLAGTTPTI